MFPSNSSSNDSIWDQAVASLKISGIRPEIEIEEVPAPARLAPHSAALAADAVGPNDEDLANGRFVVLHDPEGQETWDGNFRIVSFVKASIEADVVNDEIFDEVAWSWLTETLSDFKANHHNISGTVTRTVSRSFAGLEDRPKQTELELRASWTPESFDLGPHLQAWLALLEICAGLIPLPQGITAIGRVQ